MHDVFAMIAAERRQLADLLDALTEDQWNTASLCSGWRVRDVVAHLDMLFALSVPKMLLKLAAARFDFDRVSDQWAKNERRPPAELVAVLRANAEHRFTPPGFGPEAPLTDVVVHGQDIRRPLGLPTTVPPEHARVVLDLLVSKKAARGFVKKGLVDGVELTAVDAGWSHGHGKAVRGTADALITALAGRPQGLAALSGEGVAALGARLAPRA